MISHPDKVAKLISDAASAAGVRLKDFAGQTPYSKQDMRIWLRDFRLYFELAEVKSEQGATA
jgi:hypothetical protein